MRAAEILERVEQKLAAWVAAGNAAALFPVADAIAEAQQELEFWARLFMYYLARGYDGSTQEDAGTELRLVMKAANKYGFPRESAWPYSDNQDPKAGPVLFSRMPNAEAFRLAYDQRYSQVAKDANLIDYARITETGYARVDVIKQASAQRHLVMFGTLVTNEFCSDPSANGGKPIDPPTSAESSNIAGGHALTVTGYDEKGPIILNSWGEDFGEGGFFRYTWDYLTWVETTDLWIVRRAPIFTG